MFTPSPSPAQAQVFSTEQQATLDSLRDTLIALLTQQIAALQAEIQKILAAQAETQTTVQNLGARVETVTQTPLPTGPVVTFGEPACDYRMSNGYSKIKIPFDVSGQWSSGYHSIVPELVTPNKDYGRHPFASGGGAVIRFDTGDVLGAAVASVTIDGQVFSKQFTITDLCQ